MYKETDSDYKLSRQTKYLFLFFLFNDCSFRISISLSNNTSQQYKIQICTKIAERASNEITE